MFELRPLRLKVEALWLDSTKICSVHKHNLVIEAMTRDSQLYHYGNRGSNLGEPEDPEKGWSVV